MATHTNRPALVATVWLGTLLGLAVAGASPAVANPVKSLYSTVELSHCRKVARHVDGDAWECAGLRGYPIYVAEGDQRQFVSVGTNAAKRRAAQQTLGPFNSIFAKHGARATIEWRYVMRNGRPLPYAIIVRYHTSQERTRGDVLVVMKVTESETCHVAKIDALVNPDPLILARNIADEEARKFDCRQEPRARGATGKSPM